MGACSREGSRDRLPAVDLLPGVRSVPRRHRPDPDARAGVRPGGRRARRARPRQPLDRRASTSTSCPELPPRYRVIAPDMRGFGDSEPAPLDATRGLADWADDTAALLRALDVDRAAAPRRLVDRRRGDRPVRAGPAGGVADVPRPRLALRLRRHASDGTPCFPDGAGSGGGGINPEVVARLRAGDTSGRQPVLAAQRVPRVLRRARVRRAARRTCWSPRSSRPHLGDDELPRRRHDVGELAGRSRPARRGILNALSPRYCRWADIVDLDPKPPVLWTHGAADLVVADGSPLEMGTLGAVGRGAGLAGRGRLPAAADGHPDPRACSSATPRRAASVRAEIIEGSGHGPHLDAAPRWLAIFRDFLATIG